MRSTIADSFAATFVVSARLVARLYKLERLTLGEPDRLPVAHADGLLESALVEFPVHEFVRGLR